MLLMALRPFRSAHTIPFLASASTTFLSLPITSLSPELTTSKFCTKPPVLAPKGNWWKCVSLLLIRLGLTHIDETDLAQLPVLQTSCVQRQTSVIEDILNIRADQISLLQHDADEFVDSLDHPRHAGKEDVLLPVCVVATHIALVVGDQVARGDEVPGFTVIVGLKIFSKSAKKYIKIRFINQKGFPSNNFTT